VLLAADPGDTVDCMLSLPPGEPLKLVGLALAFAIGACGCSKNGGSSHGWTTATGGAQDLRCPPAGPAGGDCAADLATDPKNCGACGHDCLGGACFEGCCEPVTLVTQLYAPERIVVDAKRAYWTSSPATVKSVSLSGGPVTTISEDKGPLALTLDATSVYWGGYGGVAKAPLEGGSPTVLIAESGSTQSIWGVAVDAEFVYWTDSIAGTLQKVPLAGGPATVVCSLEGGASALAIQGKNLYWLDNANLWKVPVGGGAPELIAAGADNDVGYDLAVDETNAYWTTWKGQVFRMPLDGGEPRGMAHGSAPQEIAVDAEYIYWTDFLEGTIQRKPIADDAVSVELATGQLGATGIAVDDEAIYWTVRDSHKVMKLAK